MPVKTKWKNGFEWPNGAAIAVVFNTSWETWPKYIGTAKNNQRKSEIVDANAAYGRWMMPIYEHAYAETSGMQRLLDICDRYGIKMTLYTSGLAGVLYPALMKQIADLGHDYIVQGWDHTFPWEQTVAELTELIDKTKKTIEGVIGKKITGYSSSAGAMPPETFDIIEERGFTYSAGFRNCDVPFIIPRKKQNLVGMNSYDLCDFNAYGHQDHSPRDVCQMWVDEFETLYDEGVRGYPKMLAYGTHPFLSHGYRTRPMEELIRMCQSRGDVWITTRSEIAAWTHKNFPKATLETFYPDTAAASDRWYGLSTGAGGEEADREARSFRIR